ncbi:Dabb family protein [Myroides sp. C4067]|uniref:Dabb family protein n=1 Tax=Myroides sp. C4067 TaxID=3136765 RepID=UPI0031012B39
MITHIVMWRLKDENKEANKLEIKRLLEDLKGKIEVLESIAVSFNDPQADPKNFEVILHTTFKNLQDLDIYVKHPEHLKVVDFIKSVVTERVAIDY